MVVVLVEKGPQVEKLSREIGLNYKAIRFTFEGREFLEIRSLSPVLLALIKKRLVVNDEEKYFESL